MSGTFPTTILPRSFQVINNRPTLINQSVSGKRVTRKYGSQYWTLEVGLPPLNKNDGLGVFGRRGFHHFTLCVSSRLACFSRFNLGMDLAYGKDYEKQKRVRLSVDDHKITFLLISGSTSDENHDLNLRWGQAQSP